MTISYKYILYTLIYLIKINWERKNTQTQPVDEYIYHIQYESHTGYHTKVGSVNLPTLFPTLGMVVS